MGAADRALGRRDLVCLIAELRGVGTVDVGVIGIHLGEPGGDLGATALAVARS